MRYGHTGRGSPPLAQAETQTKPNPVGGGGGRPDIRGGGGHYKGGYLPQGFGGWGGGAHTQTGPGGCHGVWKGGCPMGPGDQATCAHVWPGRAMRWGRGRADDNLSKAVGQGRGGDEGSTRKALPQWSEPPPPQTLWMCAATRPPPRPPGGGLLPWPCPSTPSQSSQRSGAGGLKPPPYGRWWTRCVRVMGWGPVPPVVPRVPCGVPEVVVVPERSDGHGCRAPLPGPVNAS